MKILLISHIADVDGVMPVILTDLVCHDYDYQLLDTSEINPYMKDLIESKHFLNYDQVIITDLSFNKEIADMVNNSKLKDQLILIDHHASALYLNDYSFANIIVKKDGINQSATSLYYEYLLKNYGDPILLKDSVKRMVELARLGDTWDWVKDNVLDARLLGTLLVNYGVEKFIEHYKQFLREHDTFSFNEVEKSLFEIDLKKKNDYIDFLKDKVIFRNIAHKKVGIVFAEQYRSEVGHALANYYRDKVDLILIINFNHGLSFRSTDDGADVNEFAKLFDGGGHVHASGALLPNDFLNQVIDLLISNINMIK